MYLLNIIAVLTAVIFTTSLGSPVAHLSSRDISSSAAKDSDPLDSPKGSTASDSLDAASQLPALSPTTAVDATPVLDFEAEASHSGIWNLCFPSSFEDHTTAESPSTMDCFALANQVLAMGSEGHWTAWFHPYTHLVSYGECAFGVEACCGSGYQLDIGNEDIALAIYKSINKFGTTQKVSAKGSMICEGRGHETTWPLVTWSIYHTKTLKSRDAPSLPPPISDPSPILGLSTTTNEEEIRQELTFAASSSSNECGPSSFQNQRDNASPSIDDCLRMTADMANAGYWEVMSTGRFVHVANSGTCVFSVTAKVIDRGLDEFFFVGNQDIIDLVNSSVQMFGSRGKVAAQGEMECVSYAGNDHRTHVQWAIYNSDTLSSNSTANDTLPFFVNETLAGGSLARKSLAPKSLVSSILPAKAAAVVDSGRQCDYPDFTPTFQGETSPHSPLAQDCLDLASSLQPDFFWSIDMQGDPKMNLTEYHIVVTQYTCSFSVNVDSDSSKLGLSTLYMGAQDIKHAIDVAVQRFAFHGLVAAEGRLMCRADGNYTGKEAPVTVHWALLNPEFSMV
ncbi:putative necrosis-inducing factor-domain-containing protein [Coniochaeta sp. 2T2.1]|nr:putative necrosis-inducing factor-domain-containing protein [Coniochaeta sp. 2T2.1]